MDADAQAEHIEHGDSPYLLETYRYTPALAFLMLPNVGWFCAFGKLLFVAADVGVGLMIHQMLQAKGTSSTVATWCACAWLFNPITATVSTRGNAEPLLAAMVVGALHAVQARRPWLAGSLIGLGSHSKIFPAMYALPILLYMDADYSASANIGGGDGGSAKSVADSGTGPGRVQEGDSPESVEKSSASTAAAATPPPARFITAARLRFAAGCAGTFVGLTAIMYRWYGYDFLHQAYFYHLTRRDHRHNFSPYFLMLYLTFDSEYSIVLGLMTFLPQVLLLVVISFTQYRRLALCCFLQTVVFVIFNKVSTAQYFLWYLCLLPLILPNSTLRTRAWVRLGAVWILSQAGWLASAYFLEFEGYPSYLCIGVAGLGYFAANVYIACVIVAHHKDDGGGGSGTGDGKVE